MTRSRWRRLGSVSSVASPPPTRTSVLVAASHSTDVDSRSFASYASRVAAAVQSFSVDAGAAASSERRSVHAVSGSARGVTMACIERPSVSLERIRSTRRITFGSGAPEAATALGGGAPPSRGVGSAIGGGGAGSASSKITPVTSSSTTVRVTTDNAPITHQRARGMRPPRGRRVGVRDTGARAKRP